MQRAYKLYPKIIGTGSYIPSKVLTNQELEKMVETSDEWIVDRTGIRERRIADTEEYTSDMGIKAAVQALDNAKVKPEEIELILFATLTPDYIFPSTACLAQTHLGARNAAAVDIQAACSGYLYALSIAQAYIQSKIYSKILIIASEKLSSIVNYQDRNTCILFGDGAASCVVSSEGQGLGIKDVFLGSDGEQADLLILPGGGSRCPATIHSIDKQMHYIHLNGREVYKHAVRRMEESCKNILDRTGLKEGDIAWLIPHQANIRIIESVAKRFNIPMESVYLTLHKYGNTSCSSIGIALDELLKEQRCKKNDHILLTAFGAGFTWGAGVVFYE